jgi:hypothetical protein
MDDAKERFNVTLVGEIGTVEKFETSLGNALQKLWPNEPLSHFLLIHPVEFS